MVITRIHPMSCAKVSGLLYAGMGLIFGAFFSIVMMSIGSAMPDDDTQMMGPFFGAIFGVGAIVMMPIFYGILGFVGGGLAAVVYNLVAGWTGGIELDVR